MRIPPVLTLVIFLGGCGAAKQSGTGSPLLTPGWKPAPERSCQLLGAPSILPAAHQLLDLSAAESALSSVRSGVAPYFAVVEVLFDSAGSRNSARIVDASVPAPPAEALLSSLITTAPDGVDAGRPWGILLKATGGEGSVTFEVGRMEYCACSLANRTEFGRAIVTAILRVRNPRLLGTTMTYIIDVKSDSTGSIVEKRLHQSTGYGEIDRMAMALTHSMVVAPPLLNRRPIDTWSRLPVTLVFPAENQTGSLVQPPW
jgi:hypothetical protein